MNEKAAKLARRAARASGTMKKLKKGERGQKLPKAAKRLWNSSTPAKRGSYTADWLRVAQVERNPRLRWGPYSRSERRAFRKMNNRLENGGQL